MEYMTNDEVSVNDFNNVIFLAGRYSTRFMGTSFSINKDCRHALSRKLYEVYRDRFYHGPAHLINMSSKLECLIGRLPREIFTTRAIAAIHWMNLLHDWTIRFGKDHGWNEKVSTKIACFILQDLGYSPDFILLVQSGIEATATHTLELVPHSDREIVGLFLDLDLMGLGHTPTAFKFDTEQVWREQKQHTTRVEFDDKLVKWAQTLLDKDHIYFSDIFQKRDLQARCNLQGLTRQ